MTVSAGALGALAVVAALVFALTRPADPGQAHGDGKTVPPKPHVSAAPTGPESIMVSWQKLRNVDSYTLAYFDPSTGQTFNTEEGISAQQTAKQVDKLEPAKRYCFKLFAVNGDKIGPESTQACATTEEARVTPSSPTPSDGQSSGSPSQTVTETASTPPTGGPDSPVFTPDQWIAVVEQYPADAGVTAETSARDLARRLTAAGVPSGVLFARGQYPGLTNASGQPLTDSWVVYAGPATTPQQVESMCTGKAKQVYNLAQCTVRQPARAS